MFPTIAIANEFLELAAREGVSLSQMKLQKLVYFAYGWSLALRGDPLVNEQVECWDYGPVFPSLYRRTKRYGADPILGRIVAIDGIEPRLPVDAPSDVRDDIGIRPGHDVDGIADEARVGSAKG